MEISELSAKFINIKKTIQETYNFDREDVLKFIDSSLDLLYPGMWRKKYSSKKEVEKHFSKIGKQLKNILLEVKSDQENPDTIIHEYLEYLFQTSSKVKADAQSLLEGDPAATNIDEVVLCYPGFYAVAVYRVAHFFHTKKHKVFARLISEMAHEKTGIDIHPGATIGEGFFIDHGTGIVIGETAIIGNHVKIYQGVTLGAVSVEKNHSTKKRHPTIEDHCVIYAHATILGGETVIGHHSVIGGNVWMTKSVSPHSLVYHKSEVKLDRKHTIDEQEELTYEI